MEAYYTNQRNRLRAITNRPIPKTTIKGTDKYTPTTIKKRRVIGEARLLLDQATTAGGWNILRHEIANFLAREE
jgi:hypothetical protein